MSDEEKVTKPKRGKQRSGMMKLLGSTKITPILGLAALLSILYYKNKSTKAPPKPTKARSVVDRQIPLLAPMTILGRTRDGGPMLTKSLFGHSDLIVRKRNQTIELGFVTKTSKLLQVRSFAAPTTPLLAWIKAGDGHFALLRLTKATQADRQRLQDLAKAAPSASLRDVAGVRRLLYQARISLPSPLGDPKISDKVWRKQLLEQSHYNDFAAR